MTPSGGRDERWYPWVAQPSLRGRLRQPEPSQRGSPTPDPNPGPTDQQPPEAADVGDAEGTGGPAGPDPSPNPSQGGESRPAVREQLQRTIAAARGLLDAHVDLLKAELGEIADQIKLLAALAGLIFVALVFMGLLTLIGGALFLGEWLLGSMGWGLIDGLLLAFGSVVALALAILDVRGRLLATSFAWALLLGVVVAVVLGTNVVRQGAGQLATGLGLSLNPDWAPVVVSIVGGALLFGLLGTLLGAQGGRGQVAGGLVMGLVLGALAGWLAGGIAFSRHGAAAVGLTVGAIAWPFISGLRAARAGLDPKARFERLWPRRSYEAALETKSYLEQQWAKRRNALSRK
jgi:hypothetical protein